MISLEHGPLEPVQLPAATTDLRVETGMREGDEIPIFYDALMAKLIVWAATARTRAAVSKPP